MLTGVCDERCLIFYRFALINVLDGKRFVYCVQKSILWLTTGFANGYQSEKFPSEAEIGLGRLPYRSCKGLILNVIAMLVGDIND